MRTLRNEKAAQRLAVFCAARFRGPLSCPLFGFGFDERLESMRNAPHVRQIAGDNHLLRGFVVEIHVELIHPLTGAFLCLE